MAFGEQFIAVYGNTIEAGGKSVGILLDGSARIGRLHLDACKALLQSLEAARSDGREKGEAGDSPLAQAMLWSDGLMRGTRWLQACFDTTAKLNADVNAALWDQAQALGGTLIEACSAGAYGRGTAEPVASASFAEHSERRVRRAA